MKAHRIPTFAFLAACLLGGALALHWRSQSRALEARLTSLAEAGAQRDAQDHQLAQKVEAGEAALASVERELDQELARAGKPDAGKKRNALSKELVQSRLREARRLAQAQEYRPALELYLWCFDIALRHPNRLGLEWANLLRELLEFSTLYPLTRDELLQRSTRFGPLLLDDPDFDPSCLIRLNKELGLSHRNMALYDQLPADSRKRASIVIFDQDSFVAAQRYPDVAAVYGYSMMNFAFERNSSGGPRPAAQAPLVRERLFTETTRDIEVLAGVNDLEHASSLASRLLALAGTAEERERIQKALTRAGHPELWGQLNP